MDSVYKGRENCCGCALCEARCPRRAVRMERDEEGFLYPVIDRDLCIDCGICESVCPLQIRGNLKEDREPRAYAAKHKSAEVLLRSTSGGAFTALSDVVLRQGGAVCGADFDDDLRVVHRVARDRDSRDRMRISKYVQSDMRGIYEKMADALEKGPLLFTGTPCQCAAVRSFFRNRRGAENLFVCDIICHSVPSPLVWEEYKKLLEEECGGKLSEVFFRSKKYPWLRTNSNKGFMYKIEGDEEFREDDRFYKLFIYRGTIARPSCEFCRFTDVRRASDITIADCFGIERNAPDLYDPLGVSLILVNTQKGAELLSSASEDLMLCERPLSEMTEEQQRLSTPGKFPEDRGEFWESLRRKGLKSVL